MIRFLPRIFYKPQVSKTSKKGKDFIKSWESLQLKSYLPTLDDVWTIGFGTTRIKGVPVFPGMTITKERAEELFEQDLDYFERCVFDLVKRKLSQNQFDALVSFAYNVGVIAFKDSTLLERINDGSPVLSVGEQFDRWVFQGKTRLKGLVRRRAAERAIFERGEYPLN